MYLIIPLILILASAGGIFFIVWRKLSHLENFAELDTLAGSFSIRRDWRGIVEDLCPEVLSWAKGIKIEEKMKEHREIWFIEMEKFLRRFRVFSLKMDRMSDSLIKKIRSKTYANGDVIYSENERNTSLQGAVRIAAERNEKEEFKKEEQRLILEIAKNPKSALLYEELGNFYYEAGNYKDAKESYEAAIELSPQNEELKKKLSQALEKLNLAFSEEKSIVSKPEGSQK